MGEGGPRVFVAGQAWAEVVLLRLAGGGSSRPAVGAVVKTITACRNLLISIFEETGVHVCDLTVIVIKNV